VAGGVEAGRAGPDHGHAQGSFELVVVVGDLAPFCLGEPAYILETAGFDPLAGAAGASLENV
jgi:hypothetical protein